MLSNYSNGFIHTLIFLDNEWLDFAFRPKGKKSVTRSETTSMEHLHNKLVNLRFYELHISFSRMRPVSQQKSH